VKQANARADLTTSLHDDIQSGAAATPDYEKVFADRVAKRMEQDQKGYHTGAGVQLAAVSAANLSSEFRVQAQHYQAVAVGQQASLGFKMAMDQNQKTLMADPMQNQSVVSATLAALHDPNGAYAPNLSAQQIAELDVETRQTLAIATVRGVIQTASPEIALDMIKKGTGGAADLSADQMKQLEAEAEREQRNIEIERDRLERRAEKDLAIAREDTMQDFVARVNAPGGSTLSTKDILASNLSPAQKEHFIEQTKVGATRPNPAVINKAFYDIHRPIGDPLKITQETQLYALYGRGVDFAALNHLRAELKNDPLGDSMNTAEATAAAMITRGTIGASAPEYAQAALYRWRLDFSAAVQKAVKEGRDPRDLITPGHKDYLLSPQRIQSYVVTEFGLSAVQKTKVDDGLAAARAEMLKPNGGSLPKIMTVAERDALSPLTYYYNATTGQLGFRP